MGTRAVYTFIDEDGRHSVYKHWDGYPAGACKFIANARTLAWALPRFEADEFAAAFVAANKKAAGDVRLTSGTEAHGDLAYAYEIRCPDGRLHVRILGPALVGPDWCETEFQALFEGNLEDAQQFAATY
jgi:hypothetical protein